MCVCVIIRYRMCFLDCIWSQTDCLAGSQGRKWTQLRPQDVVFVCGHSYNVAQFLADTKTWEGKTKTAGRAKYLIYCSNKVDKKTSAWTSNVEVVMGVVHMLFEITGYVRPGREQRPTELGGGAWPVEWQLRKIATFGPPFSIHLETGVGRGALHPTAANPHLTSAFQQVQSWLLRNKVPCP
jgi:hypothetical protein